jgi:myo-inositol-1(or 4)-monophosphatase
MMSSLEDRHAFALELALRAGRLAQSMRQSLAPIAAKSAIDFCTEADLAVERLVRDAVAGRFGDAVIGEEQGGEAADDVWVVDPIDGTAGYIHETTRWCVSLAFMRAGRIEIGVIFAPEENRLFSARRGGGAFLNGAPIRVSGLAHAAAPVVEVGWSARRPLSAYCDLLAGLTQAGMEFRRHGSGALGLADVAAGRNDAYVELHINSWDALAGILLVEEAGGWTNEFLADDGLRNGNLLVAATPQVKDTLIALTGAR